MPQFCSTGAVSVLHTDVWLDHKVNARVERARSEGQVSGRISAPCGVWDFCVLDGVCVEKHVKRSTMVIHVLQNEACERWNAKSKKDVIKGSSPRKEAPTQGAISPSKKLMDVGGGF